MKVHDFASAQDYFLRSFENSKKSDPALTIQLYSKSVGIGCSTMKMILSGKRKPTVRQVLSAAKASRLSPDETSYLETLVLKETAVGSWEKSYYSQLLNRKKREIKISTTTTTKKDLLADILSLPLLVDLIETRQTEIDPAKLASRFRVRPERISQILAGLQNSEVLQKKPDGQFHVVFDKFRHRYLQKKYLINWMTEASRRIEVEYENPDSLFVSYSFSTTQESLANLRMEIKELMEKYMSEPSNQGSSREIAQACFQIFPVTGMSAEKKRAERLL